MLKREYNFAVRSSQFAVRHFYTLLAVLSLLAFLFLYRYAGVCSLWIDELCTVSSVRSSLSFSDTFKIYASYDVTPPLYPFITFIWYRIVPHTEQALRAISIIFTLMACCVIGIIGKKLSGPIFGMFAYLFSVSNSSVLLNAAFQFRQYSLLMLITSVNLYFYLRRLENETWFNILLYGVTMTLMPYTHYVSVLFYAGFFIADCIMISRKRASFRVIASYFVGALLFMPWVFIMLQSRSVSSFGSFWPKVPSFRSIYRLAKWLAGDFSVMSIQMWLALCGVIIVLNDLCRKIFTPKVIFLGAGLLSSALMVLAAFVYSRYINPGGSFFVERYFFPIMPVAMLIMAHGAVFMYERFKPGFGSRTKQIFACVMFVLIAVNFNKVTQETFIDEPYREAAEFISQDSQGLADDAAIVLSDGNFLYGGWKDMYLTADNTRETLPAYILGNMLNRKIKGPEQINEILDTLEDKKYKKIYLCYLHTALDFREEWRVILDWLRENYNFGERIDDHNLQVLTIRQ